MKSNLLPVSSTGFKYIGYCALAFVVFSIFDLDLLAFISFVLIVTCVFIYRNPEREILSFEANSLLSPVDGRVISIEDIQDSKYAYKIEIQSNYLDVGVLRVPLDASVESINMKKGARLPKSSSLHNCINEKVELTFVDSNLNSVQVKHQLNRSFDGLHIDVSVSQKIRQSSRYGTMQNGTTTIYLPQNFRVNVALGNELKASETLMGYFS